MFLFTAQMAKGRLLKGQNVLWLDTTVKTGNKLFAPTWDIVMGIKEGKITEEEYTQRYYQLMRESYKQHKAEWLALFQHKVVILACYCADGAFCHRHLLANILEKIALHEGLSFKVLGELRTLSDISAIIDTA